MRITGNFSNARKKKAPEPKAILSNLDDWLHGEALTALLRRSFGGDGGGCKMSASSALRPEN
jgi:hypothetical protein